MPDDREPWTLHTSICTKRGSQLIYRSPDGLLGLWVTSSSGPTKDRRRYFIWHLPDSAPEWETEEEARVALAQEV